MLFERRTSEFFHVSQTPPGSIIKGWGMETAAGKIVTVESSMTVPTVLACFAILMDDIASLPLVLYRRLERGKERDRKHPYYRLMHDRPNPEHTSIAFRQFIVGHMLGRGNFYGQLIWDSKGIVQEVWPLHPDRMRVFREKGERKYLYTKADGSQRAFRQDEILHITDFYADGLVGYSRITLARNAIGLSMAMEEYGSKVMANDARPSIALKLPQKLDKEAQQRLRESWNEIYRGSDNASKVAILEQGLDLVEIGFPPEEAQFLESRQFQVAELARIFRIPPHMIGDVQKSTSWGSGIEQQEQGYVAHTLKPICTRIEQSLNKDLLLEADQETHFFQHLFDDLLRGDTQARMSAYAVAITNGILSRNEVREKENLNPYDGGDEFLTPMNLSTGPADEPAGAPEPDPDDENDMDGEGDGTPQRDIDPLLQDALERITRRELHDVSDAVKRWGEKKPEKLAEWQTEFYRREHPAFIVQQLTPFVRAGYLGETEVQQAARSYCDAQLVMLHQYPAIAERQPDAWAEQIRTALLAAPAARTGDAGLKPARRVEEMTHA